MAVGGGGLRTKTYEVSQIKQPGLTWLTQVGMLVLLCQPQAPGMVGEGKEVFRLGRSRRGPA